LLRLFAWYKKPGSAVTHLLKRRVRGHLPAGATLAGYERVISSVVSDDEATVHVYWYEGTPYIAVVAVIENRHWLVMFGLDGVMETAFVVENPDSYLSKPEFELLGSIDEVLA
jgi:hypothetical protein